MRSVCLSPLLRQWFVASNHLTKPPPTGARRVEINNLSAVRALRDAALEQLGTALDR